MITIKTLPHGPVEILTHRSVEVDGQTFELPPHGRTLCPGDDLSGEAKDVRAVCKAWWTTDRVAQFNAIVLAAEDTGD